MIKSDKNGLDEMQKAIRNKIGNQSFMLVSYLLLLDIGLYGFGVRWLAYPVNVMVIIIVCMSIYLARIIAHNSYLPPQSQKSKPIVWLALIIIFAVILAIAVAMFYGKLAFLQTVNNSDNSAIILFIVSLIGLVIALIVTVIKRNDNK